MAQNMLVSVVHSKCRLIVGKLLIMFYQGNE